MCKQEIHFFNPNDVLKKRKLAELSCPGIPWRGGQGRDCLPGEPGGHRGIVAGSLEKAGVRQIFFFPAIWSLPGSCLGRPKESGDSHLFQLVGVSRRWVTASTLVGGTGSHQPTCGYPELFLFLSVFPSFCFCLRVLTSRASQGRCDIGLEPVKRGDLLTFAFSQGVPYAVDLFVTNSGT